MTREDEARPVRQQPDSVPPPLSRLFSGRHAFDLDRFDADFAADFAVAVLGGSR